MTKNTLRQLRHQVGSFVGVMIIVAVAVGFYATLKTTSDTYSQTGHEYFREHKLPSAILGGAGFSESDAEAARAVNGVTAVQQRTSIDAKYGDKTLRVLSYDIADPRVNTPYIYEGNAPSNADECLLLKKFADANDISIGKSIELTRGQFRDSCRVTGLATTPEHAYLSQNTSTPIADPHEFGIIYVATEFAARNHLPQSELAILTHDNADITSTTSRVKRAVGESKVVYTTERDSIFSYDAFSSDVIQFDLFAVIFPTVFFAVAAIVIYVSQRRNVLLDRKQIGILKAMGVSSAKVTGRYLTTAFVIATGGLILGLVMTLALGPWLTAQFNVMLDMPNFSFGSPYPNTLLPALFAFAICASAAYFAVHSIVKLKPAEAMRPESPRIGKDVLLQKIPVWRFLSFNTRYGLKAALRNRGRFWAMVVGMTATMTLLVFSLGFHDSFVHATSMYFDDIAKYDATVHVQPTPHERNPDWLRAHSDKSEKVLMLPVKVSASDIDVDLPLYISNQPFAMHKVTDQNGQQPALQDGVVIPRYHAEKLSVRVGDKVRVHSANGAVDGTLTVTGLSEQMMAFSAIATYDTAKKIGLESPIYTTVFLTSKESPDTLKKNLERYDDVQAVGTLSEERASIERFTGLLNTYIIILVGFSILLGIATLYSISTITLLAREYEFILLRVMGYGRRDILLAYSKELVLQAIVSIPIGATLGYIIAAQSANAFATDSMIFRVYIRPETYIGAVLILFVVLLYVLIQAYRQIGRQQLVEGLKSREE